MTQVQHAVTVSKRAAAQLRTGHLWVFSTDVIDAAEARNGDVVSVIDERNRVLGLALYSQQSKIALRSIAALGVRVNRDFWRRRLIEAVRYRQQVVSNTNAFRLVFSESDLLPSLIIDRYADYFVLQTLTPGMEALKNLWVELLVELFAPQSIIERNDARVRQLEGLELRKGTLHGSPVPDLVITMNGVQFQVDLLGGQKTGAFLDQRENYQAARQYGFGRALDCFCYAGGFSLHLANQCASVLAVDSSEDALIEARKNATLNGRANIEFVGANVFDYLRQLVKREEKFETIVLDPPAFAKSREAIEGAIRGHKEINLRAMRLLRPGGILISCTCSYHISEEMFLGILASAAADAQRRIRIIEKRMQARDHPVLLSMPETYYLKCIVLQLP